MNRLRRDHDDYGNYDDYRNDAHYHSARNLTDEFERDYRNSRGSRHDDRYQEERVRSYHEGDMGDAYERRSRQQDNFRGSSVYRQNEWDRDRDRFSNYNDDDTSYRGMDRSDSMDENRSLRGNLREGYGISDYEGTSDRYNTLNSDQYSNRSNRGYYSGDRENDRGSRYGSSMGTSSIHSDRGIPNYSSSSFEDDYGTLNRNYSNRNTSGSSDYSDRQRGGSFRNQNYGSSSGNYSNYGSRGNSSYSDRDNTGYGRNYGRRSGEYDRYED